MRLTLQACWDLLKEAASKWSEDDAARLGAALAYYTVFSLAPLLLIVLFVVGLVWGGQSGAVRAEVLGQVEALAGPEGAALVRTMLEEVRPGSGSVLAVAAGVAALLFGATGVFAQLQGALNAIWEVRRRPGRGLRGFVVARLLSFGMVLGIGFLLLVSLVVSALLAALDSLLTGITPLAQWLFHLLNLVVSFGVVTLLFAMIFRYLPDVEIAWRDVGIGAALTALLFTLGKFAIGLYLGSSSVASAYGAAGSLVVLLLWVYYSAQLLFFGAEFTQVYARRYGTHIRPSAHAVPLAAPGNEPAPLPPAPAAAGKRQTGPALRRLVLPTLAFFAGHWLGRRR